ncbi:MAG: hypothetical protein O8C61_12905 [Candidatus Methanoperedens sp.]|nr:hypothetical protein [Candidatus Methanoperedens sp.]
MSSFKKKWGLTIEALVIVFILLVLKAIIFFYDLEVANASPLIPALVGGVIFTIAIIFTGTLADYKESEKIPGELAASIKALYNDSKVLPIDDELTSSMRTHIIELLHAINSNFRKNNWDLHEIDSTMNTINNDIRLLTGKGMAPPLIVKLRVELINIDKISNRIKTIAETSFIPAAYGIAELAVAAVLIMLLFLKIEPVYEGLALIGATSSLLIGLILLIKDMDNPFEVGKKTYADVDLGLLWDLEEYLKN